jgi:hypothetical protein
MSGSYLSEADWINGILLRPVDLELPGVGTVQVRGLSAIEVDDMQVNFKDRPVLMMLEAVAKGMVTPKLSAAGIEAMHNGNTMLVEIISRRILELSGRGEAEQQDPLAGAGSPSPAATTAP